MNSSTSTTATTARRNFLKGALLAPSAPLLSAAASDPSVLIRKVEAIAARVPTAARS